MYTIIGGDGKEYGPATAQQIRAWIASGRASLDTQAKADGTNEWKRLAEHADFIAHEEEALPPAVAALAEGNLAGRLSRLGACVINGILTALCAMPLMNPNYAGLSAHNGYSFAFSDMFKFTGYRNLAADGWPLMLFVVVQVVMLSTLGQSIGKRLCRIRIVRHRDGANPGFLRAVVLRALVPELIGAIPIVGTIFVITDICFIFSANRRCLHDLIADTVVVRAG